MITLRTPSCLNKLVVHLALAVAFGTAIDASALASVGLQHLQNGSFQQTFVDAGTGRAQETGWVSYGKGYEVDEAVRHGDANSLRCTTSEQATTLGAMQNVGLSQTLAEPVVVWGWSKAQDVAGGPDSDYSVYVDLIYVDGSHLWGQAADFDTGTHDWQRRQVTVDPAKPLKSMMVYALFRNHAGTVWFSDFDAKELPSASLFDGQSITAPAGALHTGWYVRNVGAGTPLLPLRNNSRTLELVSWESARSVTLQNMSSRIRAITVYYVEHFGSANAVWWSDIRHSVAVEPDSEHANLTSVGAGATGQMSLYPFGCVTDKSAGLGFAIPPSVSPCIARIGYNSRAQVLYVAYDLALAPNSSTRHATARVAIVRLSIDPIWGFRSLVAKVYAEFPDSYDRRAKRDGIWMPFTDPSNVAGLADFHVAYHEGDNSVADDRKHGIESFGYVEPMTYWMTMPPALPRTYESALALVGKEAADLSGDESTRRQAQAVLYSGIMDDQARFNVSFRKAPWSDGAVWVLNPSPGLPHPAGTTTKWDLVASKEPWHDSSGETDGEYLDSLEGWANVLDFDAPQVALSRAQPTFDMNSLRPVLPTWFSVYAAADALSAQLHGRNKLLMANSTPWQYSQFAPLLDVLGTETDPFSETGAFTPEPDEIMNLRRTMSYHKPYLLLLNTDFSKATEAGIEEYFQRSLFYGIFPSMFSANAADHPYWQDPRLYNRDRPLFEKYIPVIAALSRAGWEPITWARSDLGSVWLERYGHNYLTVLNSSDEAQDASVTIDVARFLGKVASGKKAIVIRDVLGGRVLATLKAEGAGVVHLRLDAGETMVLLLIN